MSDDAPPAGSRILVDRRGDDLTLSVPPCGMGQPGPATLAYTGVIFIVGWAAATAAMPSVWIWELKSASDMWPVMLTLPLFLLAGVGVLLAGMNWGRRGGRG